MPTDDNNVTPLPIDTHAIIRAVLRSIDLYMSQQAHPNDLAERQLWDQIVMSKSTPAQLGGAGLSLDIAIEAACTTIRRRRAFFAEHEKPNGETVIGPRAVP
jgi:hypothetical protein